MWFFGKKVQKSTITIEIGVGEALDRYTILCLKLDEARKLNSPNTDVLLSQAEDLCKKLKLATPYLAQERNRWEDAIFKINNSLWDAEDKIRQFEFVEGTCLNLDFIEPFIKLSKFIRDMNDERAGLKRFIDGFVYGYALETKIYQGRENENLQKMRSADTQGES